MSWMNFFSGPTPEKLETKGDALYASGLWGPARQSYERALAKLEKSAPPIPHRCRQLRRKIQQAQEALAREHQQTAMTYLEGGYVEEARDALLLAMEVSTDTVFQKNVARQLAAMDAGPTPGRNGPPDASDDMMAAAPPPADEEDLEHPTTPPPEEYFQASAILCRKMWPVPTGATASNSGTATSH